MTRSEAGLCTSKVQGACQNGMMAVSLFNRACASLRSSKMKAMSSAYSKSTRLYPESRVLKTAQCLPHYSINEWREWTFLSDTTFCREAFRELTIHSPAKNTVQQPHQRGLIVKRVKSTMIFPRLSQGSHSLQLTHRPSHVSVGTIFEISQYIFIKENTHNVVENYSSALPFIQINDKITVPAYFLGFRMEVAHRQPIRCLFGKMNLDCVTSCRYLQQVDSLCRASTERFRQRYKFDLNTMKPVMSKQRAESKGNRVTGTISLGEQNEWTWEELDPRVCYIPSFYKQDHIASGRLHTPSPIQPQADTLAQKSRKILSASPTNALFLRTPTLFSIWQPRIRRTSLPDPEQSDVKSVTQKTRGRTQSQHTARSASNPRTVYRTTSNKVVSERLAPVMREQGGNSKKTPVELRASGKDELKQNVLGSQIHQRRQTKSSSDSLA
ncbi:hypothetical protein T265_14309, partial [Opisthorchis viverrini]